MIEQNEFEEFIKILENKCSDWVNCTHCRNKVKVNLRLSVKEWIGEWFKEKGLKK